MFVEFAEIVDTDLIIELESVDSVTLMIPSLLIAPPRRREMDEKG